MGPTFNVDDATRDALLLADESPDQAAQARLRRRKRFIVGRRIAFIVVVMIIGAGLAIAYAGHLPRPSRDGASSGLKILGLVLMVSGFLLEITYFVLIIRRGEFSAGWRSPSLVLGWRQRRDIRQQIRGNRQVDPALLPISRELATRMKRSRVIMLLLVAFSMIVAGQSLRLGSPVFTLVAVALGVCYLCLIPYVLWDSLRAGRFLEQHPAPPPTDRA